ncbi:SRPBCC family protein [Marinibaculum pumilum]|uniref:SRPBCC family protein n=1 Tax=Marinibaculum pumilum TaxID=1766165 RepID=A0ABV7L6E7_9PROT
MAEIVVRRRVERSADALWKLLGDFSCLDRIAPPVAACACEANEAGALRTLTLRDGGKIVERLDLQDDAARRQRYSMLEGPLPLQNYVGELQVTPDGEAACTVAWTASYAPDAGAEAELEQIIRALFEGTIDNAVRQA